MLAPCHTDTIEEYFALPDSERLWLGFIYREPFALGWDDWDQYEAKMLARHPIQYRIRESWDWLTRKFGGLRSSVRNAWQIAFHPAHPILRRSIPREWHDLTSLMVDVNFAMILQFRQEMLEGFVDWQATDHHREFEAWIIKAVDYIENERPKLEESTHDGMPTSKRNFSDSEDPNREEWSAWANLCHEREEALNARDTELLKQMIDYRGYFWT